MLIAMKKSGKLNRVSILALALSVLILVTELKEKAGA